MRYYSTVRPIMPGGYPKYSDNDILDVVTYDRLTTVVDIKRLNAYGYVSYDRPIPNKDAEDYQLVPSYKRYFQALSVLYNIILDKNPDAYDLPELCMVPGKSREVSMRELTYLELSEDMYKYYDVDTNSRFMYNEYVHNTDEEISISKARVLGLFYRKGLGIPENIDRVVLTSLLGCKVWEFVRDYITFDLSTNLVTESVLGRTLKGQYGGSIRGLFGNYMWTEMELVDDLQKVISNPGLRMVNNAITRYCMNGSNQLCRVSISTKKVDMVRVDVIEDPKKYGVEDLVNTIDRVLPYDVEDIYVLSRNPSQLFIRKNVLSSDYIIVFV